MNIEGLNGAIIYDEWKPEQMIITNKFHRVVIWLCEKLTGMKVLALYKRKVTPTP